MMTLLSFFQNKKRDLPDVKAFHRALVLGVGTWSGSGPFPHIGCLPARYCVGSCELPGVHGREALGKKRDAGA
jgi:hypothetical protein